MKKIYKQWRIEMDALLEDGYAGSNDCGVGAVREDFSSFAGLKGVISFKQMYLLEKAYKEQA